MGDVSRHLHNDSAALVADVDAGELDALEKRMQVLGGTVHRHPQGEAPD